MDGSTIHGRTTCYKWYVRGSVEISKPLWQYWHISLFTYACFHTYELSNASRSCKFVRLPHVNKQGNMIEMQTWRLMEVFFLTPICGNQHCKYTKQGYNLEHWINNTFTNKCPTIMFIVLTTLAILTPRGLFLLLQILTPHPLCYRAKRLHWPFLLQPILNPHQHVSIVLPVSYNGFNGFLTSLLIKWQY
jgi:hypothetical protein